MAQIMLAAGIDTRGNLVNLYTGEDFIAVRRQRESVTIDSNGFNRQRVLKRECATLAVEASDGGDTVENARRVEVCPRRHFDLSFHCDNRSADASAHGA